MSCFITSGCSCFQGFVLTPLKALSGRKYYLQFEDFLLSQLLYFCYFALKLWVNPGWESELSELEGESERESIIYLEIGLFLITWRWLQDSEGLCSLLNTCSAARK